MWQWWAKLTVLLTCCLSFYFFAFLLPAKYNLFFQVVTLSIFFGRLLWTPQLSKVNVDECNLNTPWRHKRYFSSLIFFYASLFLHVILSVSRSFSFNSFSPHLRAKLVTNNSPDYLIMFHEVLKMNLIFQKLLPVPVLTGVMNVTRTGRGKERLTNLLSPLS